MNIEYTKESLEPFLEYIIGLYSGIIKKDLALIEVTQNNQEYKKSVIEKKYTFTPFKSGLSDTTTSENFSNKIQLYNTFTEFVTKNCIVRDHILLKIKANDLAKEFSAFLGRAIDIRYLFPLIMTKFMETYPFITKKASGKGRVYTGIDLLKNIRSRTSDIINAESKSPEFKFPASKSNFNIPDPNLLKIDFDKLGSIPNAIEMSITSESDSNIIDSDSSNSNCLVIYTPSNISDD